MLSARRLRIVACPGVRRCSSWRRVLLPALSRIVEQADDLRRAGIDEATLADARTRARQRWDLVEDYPPSLSHFMACEWTRNPTGELRSPPRYREELNRLSVESLKQIASELFDRSNRSVSAVGPVNPFRRWRLGRLLRQA